MKLNKNDVIAVIGEKEELICRKCATDKDWDAVSSRSKVLLADKLSNKEELYFCDKCQARLKA